ncbi:MAG: hypothetical protein GF346_05095, partial [Candidatus Eisenbacteria bacterium]|nr:hypothetical protein [Candidatus Latescibacterota bacterium]MBD3301802.1 hypothetical protein [Candidatus Eisenbacteria bacterium]
MHARSLNGRANSLSLLGLAAALAGTGLVSQSGSVAAGEWASGFHRPGLDAPIHTVVEYEGDLVIAGDFRYLNGIPANGACRWDGSAWHPLGEGPGTGVRALVVFEDRLVAGGSIPAGDVAGRIGVRSWDGARWTERGEGIPPPVERFTIHQGELIAGTGFRRTGRPSSVFRLTAFGWEPVVESGQTDALGRVEIVGLESTGDSLVASRQFIPPEGSIGVWDPRPMLWDGSTWTAFEREGGDWQDFYYQAFTFYPLGLYQDRLVAGTYYSWYSQDNGEDLYIARWNGSIWERLGPPIPNWTSSYFYALAEHQEALHISLEREGIFRLDGNDWVLLEGSRPFAGTLASTIRGLVTASGRTLRLYRDGSWESPILPEGNGIEGRVTLVVPARDRVFAVGGFEWAGLVAAPHCAAWDGERWSPGPPSPGLPDAEAA